MRLPTFTVFVTTLLALGSSTHAEGVVVAQFTIDAGEVPRRNAPMVATIKGKPLAATNAAKWEVISLHGVGPSIPAQAELLGDGTVLVRWIEPDLQPGKPKRYELVPSPDEGPDKLLFVTGEGWRDLTYNGKGIWRHVNRYDPADHVNTFKPFHHVYGMHDEGFITNGPGSEEWGASGEGIRYPHHRGLFFAYN
ncbi:MAG: hypothetical protein M3478_15830, partial [Planctomycetota bacterium]|nr:hypothetical protein [Planctomycetota bacterium]